MGRLNSDNEKIATLAWAINYKSTNTYSPKIERISNLQSSFDVELKSYFALAALSRSTTSPIELVNDAYSQVFRCRVLLERRISEALKDVLGGQLLKWLFSGSFFGFSKKQGTSVRMPLLSCNPTRLCGAACYAHDVLDAAPASVIRGAINGVIAMTFESGDSSIRSEILQHLAPHSRRAIRCAQNELLPLKNSNWTRRPYIRFSHVGEIAAYPGFANALARQVNELSKGSVDCIVYTRHQNVGKLDPTLWVVNFTLDFASMDRKSWIPPHARRVFSAFEGRIDPEADVNFLEHHRWVHYNPIGEGRICPATLPETKNRTCDSVQCDRCFQRFEAPTGIPENCKSR